MEEPSAYEPKIGKQKKMSKKGRSPMALDVLPEEVMDRYVPGSDFDDLR